jgi:membrane fusion protein, multidrug efflux system
MLSSSPACSAPRRLLDAGRICCGGEIAAHIGALPGINWCQKRIFEGLAIFSALRKKISSDPNILRSLLLTVTLVCVGLMLAPALPAAPSAAPPEVAVVTARRGAVAVERELVGRLLSSRIAEVRARVSGIVLERTYVEGTDVAAGQGLFRIDPAPLQAALSAAQARLAEAEAEAANTALIAKRQRDLAARRLVAPQEVDTALANERSRAATVLGARAAVEQAQLDLGYATVTAPIAGRAGRALVTEGALVGEDEATPLVTVEQVDPIYLGFGQTVADFQRLRAALAPGQQPEVTVLLPDGSSYAHRGRLDFSDVNVDTATGMVMLRATVPNPERLLLPGMYVKLRYAVATIADAYVLPHAAVLRDVDGAYVLAVAADGTVARRAVEVREMRDASWVVTGELVDGEAVIVEGLQKVRPGATVKVVDAAAQRS